MNYTIYYFQKYFTLTVTVFIVDPGKLAHSIDRSLNLSVLTYQRFCVAAVVCGVTEELHDSPGSGRGQFVLHYYLYSTVLRCRSLLWRFKQFLK